MNKDSHLIYEAYTSKKVNLNEGILDRVKANTAGVVGGIKGMGSKIAATAKGTVAGATGNVAGVQAANQQKLAASVQGEIAKIESYRNSAAQKLQKTANEIMSDLFKLNIAKQGAFTQEFQQFNQTLYSDIISAMNNVFNKQIDDIKNKAGLIPKSQATLNKPQTNQQPVNNPTTTTPTGQPANQQQGQAAQSSP